MQTLIIILIVVLIAQTVIFTYSNIVDDKRNKQLTSFQEQMKNAQADYIQEKRNFEKILNAHKKSADDSQRNLARATYECQLLREQLEKRGGAGQIAIERARQKSVEGYDQVHDIMHPTDEFCRAAIAYAVYDVAVIPSTDAHKGWWPEKWDADMFKPKDRKRNLVRAGALIAAAIDRLQFGEIDEQA
jgi:hypothetical protein